MGKYYRTVRNANVSLKQLNPRCNTSSRRVLIKIKIRKLQKNCCCYFPFWTRATCFRLYGTDASVKGKRNQLTTKDANQSCFETKILWSVESVHRIIKQKFFSNDLIDFPELTENGRKTVGCCSHIAVIIYYLSHARYLLKIVRPAEILSKLITQNNMNPVIKEDSDKD